MRCDGYNKIQLDTIRYNQYNMIQSIQYDTIGYNKIQLDTIQVNKIKNNQL